MQYMKIPTDLAGPYPPPPLRRILAQNPPPPLKEFLDPPLIRSGARVRPNVYIGLTCVAMG